MMKINGGCHCGSVTYEAEVDPATARLCHCIDCQIMSGAPFRHNVATTIDGFKLLTGTLTDYHKMAESGAGRLQAFCPTCVTQIY